MNIPEQQHAEAMNRWLRRDLWPIRNDPCKMALRFLLRYTRGNPVGDGDRFAHATMQECEFAALDIANAVLKSSSAPLGHRASAAVQLISHQLVYPRTVVRVGGDLLRQLLREDASELGESLDMARLCRAIALSDALWPELEEPVRMALGHLCQGLDIETPRASGGRSEVMQALDACCAELGRLMALPHPDSINSEA